MARCCRSDKDRLRLRVVHEGLTLRCISLYQGGLLRRPLRYLRLLSHRTRLSAAFGGLGGESVSLLDVLRVRQAATAAMIRGLLL